MGSKIGLGGPLVGVWGPSWAFLPALMVPCFAFWAKLGPSGAQVGPSWDQDGAKLGQDAAKLAQIGAMMGPSWGQVGAKLEQSWAKLGPSCLQNAFQEGIQSNLVQKLTRCPNIHTKFDSLGLILMAPDVRKLYKKV